MENKEKIKEEIKNEKLCGIYKITSPSDKIYIGQSIDLLKRKPIRLLSTISMTSELVMLRVG